MLKTELLGLNKGLKKTAARKIALEIAGYDPALVNTAAPAKIRAMVKRPWFICELSSNLNEIAKTVETNEESINVVCNAEYLFGVVCEWTREEYRNYLDDVRIRADLALYDARRRRAHEVDDLKDSLQASTTEDPVIIDNIADIVSEYPEIAAMAWDETPEDTIVIDWIRRAKRTLKDATNDVLYEALGGAVWYISNQSKEVETSTSSDVAKWYLSTYRSLLSDAYNRSKWGDPQTWDDVYRLLNKLDAFVKNVDFLAAGGDFAAAAQKAAAAPLALPAPAAHAPRPAVPRLPAIFPAPKDNGLWALNLRAAIAAQFPDCKQPTFDRYDCYTQDAGRFYANECKNALRHYFGRNRKSPRVKIAIANYGAIYV